MQLEHIHRLALPGNQHFSDQGGLLRGLIREGLILFSWFLTLGFFFFFSIGKPGWKMQYGHLV